MNTDSKAIVRDAGYSSHNKVLKFKGDKVIQLCTDARFTTTSLLVKNNILLLLTEGTLQIKYGATEYTVEKKQMALLKKDILVECSAPLHSPFNVNYVMIQFKDDLLKEFVKLARLSVPPPQHPSPVTIASVGTRLLGFIDSLDSYFADPENIDDYLTKIKLLEILFNLLRVDNDILPQLMDMRRHFHADITTTVEENVMSPMSLSQLAVLSGRSLSSFRRDFIDIYNMPPSTWLRLRRLEKARELLLNTTMTVTDVCYTLGFETLAHFSRLFKGHFGYSPSRARIEALHLA